MASIKELPIVDRPREKALRYGIDSLSDVELVALLLNNGYKGYNILEISTSLLSKYGGIVGLLNVPISELKKNKGIKNVGALKINLISEFYKRVYEKKTSQNNDIIDDEYLYNKYKVRLSDSNQEQLVLVICSRNKKIIYETTLYKGSQHLLRYSFNDIFKQLAKFDGKNYYLIHNHPNGDSSPSEEDKLATISISTESKRLGLHLIDHLIIGSDGYYSFKKMKKISFSC